MEDNKEDWNLKDVAGILKLISKPIDSFNGRLKLQKMSMLGKLDDDIDYGFSFDFVRYHYGPYSKKLDKMVRRLVKLGYINESSYVTINQRKCYEYTLTEKGKSFLSQLEDRDELKEELLKIDKVWKRYKHYNQGQLVNKAKEVFGW